MLQVLGSSKTPLQPALYWETSAPSMSFSCAVSNLVDKIRHSQYQSSNLDSADKDPQQVCNFS